MGHVVESFHCTYKFDAVLGGGEAILSGLAVRQTGGEEFSKGHVVIVWR
jgi:hypothetical protein